MEDSTRDLCSPEALRVITIVFGSISLPLWMAASGVVGGICLDYGDTLAVAAGQIAVNVGYIFVTILVITILTAPTFPSAATLMEVRRLLGCLSTLVLAGVVLCIGSGVTYEDMTLWWVDEYSALLGCSFTFVPAVAFGAIAWHLQKTLWQYVLRSTTSTAPRHPSQMYTNPALMNAHHSQMNAYPPQINAYPSRMNAYPPQINAYPSQMNAYPPQMNAYPSQINARSLQMSAHPSQMNAQLPSPSMASEEPFRAPGADRSLHATSPSYQTQPSAWNTSLPSASQPSPSQMRGYGAQSPSTYHTSSNAPSLSSVQPGPQPYASSTQPYFVPQSFNQPVPQIPSQPVTSISSQHVTQPLSQPVTSFFSQPVASIYSQPVIQVSGQAASQPVSSSQIAQQQTNTNTHSETSSPLLRPNTDLIDPGTSERAESQNRTQLEHPLDTQL